LAFDNFSAIDPKARLMEPADKSKSAIARTPAWVIFLSFLRLGCNSFGGPIAHLGYFRNEFVIRRKWVDEETFADVVGLCQFLPGPASSQVGFTIGLLKGGPLGALAAWAAFTLPSAMIMFAFAYGHSLFAGKIGSGILHGLELVAVAIVAQAVWGMAQTLAPDRIRATIAVVGAEIVLLSRLASSQLVAIAVGAILGLILCRQASAPPRKALPISISRLQGLACLGVFATLLIVPAILVATTHNQVAALFQAFYSSGALVFGGGHVVLPLLRDAVVGPGWIDDNTFLAGYGVVQAVPGPLFTFSAYLGAVLKPEPHGAAGAAIALVALFLPGLLLVIGALPFWNGLRSSEKTRSAFAGVNASVVGILLAALYQPVWTSSVHKAGDFSAVVAAFLALTVWKAPPWIVVCAVAAVGGVASYLA
jgi:chromate transporter